MLVEPTSAVGDKLLLQSNKLKTEMSLLLQLEL